MNEEEFFDYCFRRILDWETEKYTNIPGDPGGPTKYGVTQKTLARYRGYKVTAEDVRNLTYPEARSIYKKFFWDQYNCGLLPRPLALLLFDGVVNQNGSAVCKLMQRAIGGLTIDGNIGPKTAQSAAKGNIGEISAMFMSLRAIRYTESVNFRQFGHGWMRRAFSMQTLAANLSTLNK